ncbi:alpha/beta hydrolase family esterase [Limnoglobus roseus]|uniref:Polyhydroxybutyrate depolymerase n=1 Tax=Limnoglobus roseus TaxID=2598579 RepID=A0A5C1AFL7_9BACT|nr:PHB depolymerase family esterase [Limnoglobus roseus]QEL18051.1 polyhydroxybutyrate depolymerase [Limnoglobus roseus]
MEQISFDHRRQNRRYLIFRPPAVVEAPAVVVFLPGTGGTAEWTAHETKLPAFAAEQGFVLVVPEALRPRPDQPPKFLTNPPRWNDGSPAANAELQTDADDVDFLTHVFTDAINRTGADPRRISLTGFSNGAGMTFRFAAERPDLVAAIAPVAGHCWVPPQVISKPVPTLYIIGSQDPLLPYRGGTVELPWGNKLIQRPPVVRTLERWAAVNSCSTASVLDVDAAGIREEVFPGPVEFRSITVDGLGHHWPGGEGQFNRRIGGPPSDRLDANRRIWDFFQRYSL